MLYPNQIMLDVPAPPAINLVVPISLIQQMIAEYTAMGDRAAASVLAELMRRVDLAQTHEVASLPAENVYIYALCDPSNEEVRYVGQTKDLAKRFLQHLSCREPSKAKDQWIRGLREQSQVPLMKTLFVTDRGNADRLEKKAIVDAMLDGNRLTNVCVPDEYPNIHHITWWRKNCLGKPMPGCASEFLEARLDFEFGILDRGSKLSQEELTGIYNDYCDFYGF